MAKKMIEVESCITCIIYGHYDCCKEYPDEDFGDGKLNPDCPLPDYPEKQVD